MEVIMNNNLFNNMSKFVTGQSMPQTNTSNTMMGDILKMNSTYSDIANSIKDISAKYNKDMTAFSDKYESLMNDLLAKKNKYTGNIFKDFLTDYKDARESGIGLGFRNAFLARLPESVYDVGKADIIPNYNEETSTNFENPLSFPKGYGR